MTVDEVFINEITASSLSTYALPLLDLCMVGLATGSGAFSLREVSNIERMLETATAPVTTPFVDASPFDVSNWILVVGDATGCQRQSTICITIELQSNKREREREKERERERERDGKIQVEVNVEIA